MTQESYQKMKLWLDLWPESLHDKDEERKADFVHSLKANNETADFDDLYNCYRVVKPDVDVNVAEERCMEWATEIEKLLKMM